MHANEARVQAIIDGVRQYVVPLFQRPYSWEAKHWTTLWQDLVELCEEDQPRSHFIGSIVTIPAKSVPEGVTKFLLIDGQQRLTTILVLLAAIRDRVRQTAEASAKLADRIEDLLLKNRHQDGDDVLKLLPTQTDRAAFVAVMDGRERPPKHPVSQAYDFFAKKLRLNPDVSPERLHNVIIRHLVLVSIVLDKDDNPYLIFESLNAKGRPLTQADLIRNFFFMRIHVAHQEQVHTAHWQPMQDRLGDNLTEYIRHYLMREGRAVKQTEVYYALKESVDEKSHDEMIECLHDIARFSTHYAKLLDPRLEKSSKIASRLQRLNRFEVTTAYPFLLNVYGAYAAGAIVEGEFADLLDVLENFLIRRFICGVPTHGLIRIFSGLFAQAAASGSLVGNVKAILREKNYPGDDEFRERFVASRLYGGGERLAKTKLILERLESSYGHKEQPDFSNLTVEHVMPQTLTEWWRAALGEGWEATHEVWLDTVGNLTLTAYNSELSNSDYRTKQSLLEGSHLELNRYFKDEAHWNEDAIARRGEDLAERALKVWQYFGASTLPAAEAALEEEAQEDVKLLTAAAIEQLGGEAGREGGGRFRHVRLKDDRVINVKHSKKHQKQGYYWFGIHQTLWEDMNKMGVTHLVLILAAKGFLVLPLDVVRAYLANARVSRTPGGTVRHFHVHAYGEPELTLFHFGHPDRIPVRDYYIKFITSEPGA